jgi:type I restriction enzyme S subunit
VDCGDILITKDSETPDDIGIPAVVVDQVENLVCGYHLALVKPKRELVDPVFLCKQLGTDGIARYFGQRAAGSTRYGLSNAALANTPISFPPLATQKKIASILTAADTAIEKTEALIAKYQQIKAGLMHDLFTRGVLPNGQLRPPREQAPELYQETAIGWIPREWRLARAGDLCSLITKGTTPPSTEMWEGDDGLRFLRGDNLGFDGQFNFEASSYRISKQTHLAFLSRSVCVPGDVLMNIVGPPLGKVALVTNEVGEVNINQAIAVFRPKAELSSLFLLRWLISDGAKRWILQRAKQTSGQLNVTLAMCQDLSLPYMNIGEQQRIEEKIQCAEMLVQSETLELGKLKSQKLGLMQDLLTGKVPVRLTAPEAVHA